MVPQPNVPQGPNAERPYILPWLSLVRILVRHGRQVAVVFCGAPPPVGCVSRRIRCATPPILGWETVGRVLTLRPGWVLQASPPGLFR